jgi:hypothetical protein
LRKKGISNENVGIGEYISEAIKEGLTQPENGLAGIGHFDAYYHEEQPEKPQRSLRRKAKKNTEEPEQEESDNFRTFPPNRPTRKQKNYEEENENEEELQVEDELKDAHQVPDINDFIQEINNNNQMYDEEIMRAMHADLVLDDELDEMEFMSKLPVPPTPPRRRKKKIEKYKPTIQPDIELTSPKEIEISEPEVKFF